MSECKVNQCYATNCRYNSNHQCKHKSPHSNEYVIIVKENGQCAYFITPDDWKSKVLRE